MENITPTVPFVVTVLTRLLSQVADELMDKHLSCWVNKKRFVQSPFLSKMKYNTGCP